MERVLLLPGDGIGPEVAKEAHRILEAVAARHGLQLSCSEALIGGASLDGGAFEAIVRAAVDR